MPVNQFSSSSSFSSSYRPPTSGNGSNTDPGRQQRPRHCRSGAGIVYIPPDSEARPSSHLARGVASAVLSGWRPSAWFNNAERAELNPEARKNPATPDEWRSGWGAPGEKNAQIHQNSAAADIAMQDRGNSGPVKGTFIPPQNNPPESRFGAISAAAQLFGSAGPYIAGTAESPPATVAGNTATLQNFTVPSSVENNITSTALRNIRPIIPSGTDGQIREQLRKKTDAPESQKSRKKDVLSRKKRTWIGDPDYPGPDLKATTARAPDDVVKVKIDFSCIEDRNNAGFWDHMRNIGQTLQRPTLRMAQESQVIHFYNTERRCPTPEESEALNSHKGIAVADTLIRNGLTMLPGSKPLFIAQNIVGPMLEMMADDAQGKEISPDDMPNLLINSNLMFRATIDNNMEVISREQARPVPEKKSVIPVGMGIKNGEVVVKISRYGRMVELRLTEHEGVYYAEGEDDLTGEAVKEPVSYDDVSEAWVPAESSLDKFTAEQKNWFREHAVSITEGELADETKHNWFRYDTPDGKAKYFYDIRSQQAVIEVDGHTVLATSHFEGNTFRFTPYYHDAVTGEKVYGDPLVPGEEGVFSPEVISEEKDELNNDIWCSGGRRKRQVGGAECSSLSVSTDGYEFPDGSELYTKEIFISFLNENGRIPEWAKSFEKIDNINYVSPFQGSELMDNGLNMFHHNDGFYYRVDSNTPDVVLNSGFQASYDYMAIQKMLPEEMEGVIVSGSLEGALRYKTVNPDSYIYKIAAKNIKGVSLKDNLYTNKNGLNEFLGEPPDKKYSTIESLAEDTNGAIYLDEIHLSKEDIDTEAISLVSEDEVNHNLSPGPWKNYV
jgi:hypothetical protein